ncbi:MAG TPA: MFS transporter [Candidatus Binatia bacterium]|nr:MFS transporter [Candidatus Binatia bacterium]
MDGLPRQFWVLWTGTLVNRTATFVRPFLVLYLTESRHVNLATAGAVLSVAGFGSLVSQPLGGWLADRHGRRWTLASGMAGTAASELILGYSPSLSVTFVAAAVFGLLVDLYRPAVQAMVADLVSPADRPRAYGLIFWAINLGFSIAMVLGGVLAQRGYIWLFWADAAACLIFGLMVLRAVPETRPAAEPGHSPASIGTALRDRVMMALVGLSLVYATVYAQATSGLPLAMARAGLSPTAYGLTVAANGVVIVVVQPLVVTWLARLDHSRVVALGQLLVGLGFGLTQLANSIPEYMATVVVWTLGEIATFTVVSALVADLAPVQLRARYQGLLGLAWGGGALVGPFAGAWVLQDAGSTWLWSGCAVLGMVMAVGQLGLGPAVRHRRAHLVRA